LKRLGLDEVWWLVAPQNPLKPALGMAALDRRLKQASAVAHHPRIRVLDLETGLGTRFTADTIAALQAHYPKTEFVWLMGADNLAQIRHWRNWRAIFKSLPIAVFARPTYCRNALAELAAKRFSRARIAPPGKRLSRLKPPAWIFLPVKLDPRSATAIRSREGASS
jgi:nicotinate-nucleotide adenylyltransferase